MSWRDDPEIIWKDKNGDHLAVQGGIISIWTNTWDRMFAWAPETVDDRTEAGTRFLAALGLEADDIRVAPKPIEVGDSVRYAADSSAHRVVHIDDDVALLRELDGQAPVAVYLRYVTRLPDPEPTIHADDDPESEPEWIVTRDPDVMAAALKAGRGVEVGGPAIDTDAEPEWIVTRDPDVLAAARVARRAVEMFLGDGWSPTSLSAGRFRARAGERLGVAYRYEGPALTLGDGDDQ